MKLTKLERHMAYMIMLAEFEELEKGLCLIWSGMTGEIRWGFGRLHLKHTLPELWDKADNKYGVSWFLALDDAEYVDKRITALKQCIEETEDAWPE